MIHLIFDVDGVLIENFHIDPKRQYLWWTDPDAAVFSAEQMNEHFFKPVWTDILRGQKDIHTELEPVLHKLNIPLTAHQYTKLWFDKDSRINHDLFAALRKIKRSPDIKLSLATNQEHQRASYLWNELKFKDDFDTMFYAAQLGQVKPELAFFQSVATKLAIQTSDTVLYFDDSKKCTSAAAQLGWQAVTFSELEHFTQHPLIKNLS